MQNVNDQWTKKFTAFRLVASQSQIQCVCFFKSHFDYKEIAHFSSAICRFERKQLRIT